jgi:hypothetical protein
VYDSTEDTKKHIAKVAQYIDKAVDNLRNRALVHDDSKLHDPEKAAWDEATPKLAELTYGSEEYRATLRAIKPAVQHHYQHNSHHPEYWENGIKDMSLLDLLEMLCDWKAASERTKDGDLLGSLDHNQERFGYSDELASILRNTAKELF